MAEAQTKGIKVKKSAIARRRRAGNIPVKIAAQGHSGSSFVTFFITKGGRVDVERVARAFHMTKSQLAETTGLGASTLTKTARQKTVKAQTRVTEMLEIISRVRDWAGGETQAMAWYRSEPIPALDGRTPEALVKAGKANSVREYLDHLALGGFA